MGAMAEVKKPNNTIDKLALIVTTYKRQQLLETLFDSILALEQAPWRIVIVDNEQSDQTADMVAAFAGKVTGQALISVDTSVPGFDLSGSLDVYGGYGMSTIIHEVGHHFGFSDEEIARLEGEGDEAAPG